ncbi:MAG: aldo/keto reductase [Planctomycetota bacterium]
MFDRRVFLRALMGLTAGLVTGRPSLSAQTTAAGAATSGASGASGVSGASGGLGAAGPLTEDRLGKLLPMRRLGRTGEWVTTLGFGGSHMIQNKSEAQSAALIEAALEEGVRFFDTAQQYGNGESESRMGRSLTPKYRDVIYLMTKTQARERGRALQDMDECRQRLNVDVIDLMQIHHIHNPQDVDNLVDNGVVDVLLEAREQGKIRHLGFTGHDTPKAHLHMLKRLDGLGVEFDTVQMPMNVADPGYESFIVEVLPTLIERDYGVLAMKTLAYGHLAGQKNGWTRGKKIAPRVVPERMSLAEALGFVWSLPISTLISGTPTVEMLRENAGLARAHVDLPEAARLALADKAAEFAGPDLEFYKDRV